uniref:Putative selenoprotein g n=1 Tax=Tabanus bromius TaxID=304241 RepID=A0A0K8TT55_TABBR
MVYVDRDGRVHDQRPWDMSRIVDMFTGFFTFTWFFLQSLIEPLQSIGGGQSGGGARRTGGGGGGGNDRRPPGPPNRRIGRITTMSDCSVPGGG